MIARILSPAGLASIYQKLSSAQKSFSSSDHFQFFRVLNPTIAYPLLFAAIKPVRLMNRPKILDLSALH